ncbi:MAG TPA: hypothetical protein VD969_11355 [Symbiobacteriaceae bacterium]|nr:hypothetical protein [Symbiobacteriaceae bacterium]
MDFHHESPDTRWDRVFCIGGAAAAAAVLGWLIWRVKASPDHVHTLEFIALALLAGLALYFAWLIYALSTVRYVVQDNRLLLQQAWSRLEVPLTAGTHLYRWRYRWTWDGGAQRDLGVEILHLFPPFWMWRENEIWVLHAAGKAVAFRPSPRLLADLKARVRHAGALAG